MRNCTYFFLGGGGWGWSRKKCLWKLRQGPMTAYHMLLQIKLVSLQLKHNIFWCVLHCSAALKNWSGLFNSEKYFVKGWVGCAQCIAMSLLSNGSLINQLYSTRLWVMFWPCPQSGENPISIVFYRLKANGYFISYIKCFVWLGVKFLCLTDFPVLESIMWC